MVGGDPGGGSRVLAELLGEHAGCIYADLRRYYGVDVSGVLADPPSISPAEVLALIENLPIESATQAERRNQPDSVGWSTADYLAAMAVDAVRENTFANMQVRTKKKLKPPEKLPVPGQKPRKKANSFVAMAQAQYRKAGRV